MHHTFITSLIFWAAILATALAQAETVLIDLNSATEAQLLSVPGLGPKKVQAILSSRAKRAFRSLWQLRKVKGIGRKTVVRLRHHLTVGRSSQTKARCPPRSTRRTKPGPSFAVWAKTLASSFAVAMGQPALQLADVPSRGAPQAIPP